MKSYNFEIKLFLYYHHFFRLPHNNCVKYTRKFKLLRILRKAELYIFQTKDQNPTRYKSCVQPLYARRPNLFSQIRFRRLVFIHVRVFGRSLLRMLHNVWIKLRLFVTSHRLNGELFSFAFYHVLGAKASDLCQM